MRRLLFVSPVAEFKGGAEVCLFDFMRNPEVDPVLAVPSEGMVAQAARAENIPVHLVDFASVTSIRRPVRPRDALRVIGDWWRAAARLRAVARATHAQLLHSNGLKAHCVAALARLMGAPPLIVHIHDIPFRRSETLVWRALAAIATRMLIVSRACWPGRTLPLKVRIVHNGLAVSAPPPPIPAIGGVLRIGFCGRIHPFKGVHVLLDWFAEARRRGIDAVLLIRGEASPEAGDYVEALYRQAASSGIADHVRFEGKREGLQAIYAGLDVVVVPSDTPDPLPRSVMEAMGFGLPVIGYPAGGIPDMITSGEDGWLAADADAFVAALETIAGDPVTLATISQAARRTIAERFSLPALYARLNAIYAEAGGGPPA